MGSAPWQRARRAVNIRAMDPTGRRERMAARAALGVVLVASAAIVALRATRPSTLDVDSYNPGGLFTVAVVGFAVAGALVVQLRPGTAMGWLFLAFSLAALPGDLAFEYGIRALDPATGPLPLAEVSAWVYGFTQPLAAGPFVLILLYFPSGRPPAPRWHAVTAVTAVGLLLCLPLVVTLWDVRGPRLLNIGDDPSGLGVSSALLQAQFALLVGGFAGGAAAMGWRLWRGSAEERQRVKWLAAASAVVVVAVLVDIAPILVGGESPEITDIAIAVAVLAMPVASGIGILRHRLFDIDLVIRRSFLYGLASLAIGGAYLGVAAAAGVAAGDRGPLAVAVGVTIMAMAAFQPLRQRLQQAASRRLLGERLTRYEVVARMGETLEHAFDPTELAPGVAAAVRDALGLTWARLSLKTAPHDEVVAVAGEAGADASMEIPLAHGDNEVGTLECGPKIEGFLTDEDRELVQTLARQVSLAIHNAGLAGQLSSRLEVIEAQARELRDSRTRIVRAQHDERRRIERNIHDGVQQQIVALLATVRLTRNQLAREPALADASLAEVQAEAAQLLEDLRELSQGIHPSVLIDSGLLSAIESKVARLPIGVTIDAPPGLRDERFPDEIEGVAYFVVSEALTNILKHASAASACVRLSAHNGILEVEVGDDGVGFDPPSTTGSGLTGLSDRVEAVGGRLRVDSAPGRGTRLAVTLPTQPPGLAHE